MTNQTKLAELALAYGYDDPHTMLSDYILDSIAPAICTNCDYTTDMEPDQDRGWCECCGANTVKSAFVLAGMI